MVTDSYLFHPEHRAAGSVVTRRLDDIRNEPMVYGGSLEWCLSHAGPITHDAIEEIESTPGFEDDLVWHARRGYHPVVDCKSVMLMPGMYPCIGGWHCDGAIRKDQQSQPDLKTISLPVAHYSMTLDTVDGRNATQYACEDIEVPSSAIDPGAVWGSVNTFIEGPDCHPGGSYKKYGNGVIARFTRGTLHRGPAATIRQWRYFFRMSFYHMPAMNEIRKQVQVYTDIGRGW